MLVVGENFCSFYNIYFESIQFLLEIMVDQEMTVEERRFELKRKADDYELELAERQFELKRKSEDWDQNLRERQIILQKQKLEHVDHFMNSMTRVNPFWRADARLAVQAQDLLCAAFVTEPQLVTAQGAVAPESALAPESVVAPESALAPESVVAPESTVVPDDVTKVSDRNSAGVPAEASGALQYRIWDREICIHNRRARRCRQCNVSSQEASIDEGGGICHHERIRKHCRECRFDHAVQELQTSKVCCPPVLPPTQIISN